MERGQSAPPIAEAKNIHCQDADYHEALDLKVSFVYLRALGGKGVTFNSAPDSPGTAVTLTALSPLAMLSYREEVPEAEQESAPAAHPRPE
jgi:hypothetical protein